MKRSVVLILVVCVTWGLAASAEAAGGSKNRGFSFQQFMSGSNSFGNFASKFNKNRDDDDDDDDRQPENPPKPIDPGKGDGKPSDPIPTMPGYVWVGDHWERVKAPKTDSTTPPMVVNPGTIVVRDHRGDAAGSGGVTVSDTPQIRDHRKPKTTSVFPGLGGNSQAGSSGPIIRDHRTLAESSSDSNTWSPNLPIIRDHRDGSAGSGGVTVSDGPIVRDHRGSSKGSPQPTFPGFGGMLPMGAP